MVGPIIKGLEPGRSYTIRFTKRDGTDRIINSVAGASFAVTGSGAPYDPAEKGIAFVYDLDLARTRNPRDCWRAVRFESVTEISIDGYTCKVEGEGAL